MEFRIYTASGIGRYYDSSWHAKPCVNAYLNGSKEDYPFSVHLNTAQDFINLIQECGSSLVVENKCQKYPTICVYDDYIE